MNAPPRFELYSYWRTSATYRVRVAFNLKGISPEERNVNLDSGEQRLTHESATGEFCHGNTVTQADICLASILGMTRIFKITVPAFPPSNASSSPAKPALR